ncbi:hypothetical protein [Umezawaea beigongshangensis]|uniref:hypothetical protein n=1 Tax=Umezawaea beigongshangensis TaxID=2780383 RepID=UPI0018F21F47|nr:hypothetical protein [Umezawaea beigongshangensis]
MGTRTGAVAADGASPDVDVVTPGTADEVTLDESRPEHVHVASPGLPAVSATFDLPSDAADTAVRVPWPSSVTGRSAPAARWAA